MKKTSFLLVDNNSVALRELADTLKYLGYAKIEQSVNPNDAWALLRIKDIGCIISAWDMPDMTGLALLRVVRSDDRLYDVPFFLTDTAFTRVKVVQAGQSGVSGLIVVPYEVGIIRDKIASLTAEVAEPAIARTKESLDKGIQLLESGSYENALEVFEKLLEEGETAEMYYNIGYIKTVQERYEEAIVAFRKATQLDRLFAKAYESMGRAFRKLGKDEEAEKALQKAADIYMSKEKIEDAEEILNEILQIRPDTINVFNSLGVLYRKKGDYKMALLNYQKAIRLHPKEPYVHYNIGRVYLDLKDPENAKQHFAKAVELAPKFKEARDVLNAIELGTI